MAGPGLAGKLGQLQALFRRGLRLVRGSHVKEQSLRHALGGEGPLAGARAPSPGLAGLPERETWQEPSCTIAIYMV